ncbi:TPR and ankyrin repeat-containing protein 1-like [Mizuhopecten yessoensis]|nr:TPR and ankyrin repeat-containing protein 1-like [Mizuhopecten yessoensis]
MNETVVSDTDFRVTTQEFPFNESERIVFDSKIPIEDKKSSQISVAAFSVNKDNLFEESKEMTKEKDVPQEDEEKEAHLLQGRKRDGKLQRKEEAKEDEVSEKETDKEEKEQRDGDVVLMTPYTKGTLKDTECKEEAEDDVIMGERDVEETYDVRQERGFDRTSEETNLTKSEVQNAGSAFIHKMQEDEDNQEKERGRQVRVDETMDGAEKEDDDEDCNDNDDEMAICATKKHMNGGNEDDNLAMNQDEPADRTSNAFLDQISSELDDLPWEVECTKSFVKTMTSKINSTIKNKIIMTISKLAKGDWHQSICKELHSVHKPKNTQLYESKIGKGCRLIWQRASTFSSKLSATTVNTERQKYRNKKTSGEDMYSEVIRIWNYVSNHDDIHKYVVNICSALKNENQEVFKRDPKPPSTFQRTLPAYFGSDSIEIGVVRPPVKEANEEFQIVKFYTFSPDMLNHIRRQSSLNVDFPFRITDLEHSIINLESDAPILLIGRSGTGKTTCCLYRLWHQFIAHLSIHCELPELAKPESGSENCHGEHNQAADSNKDVRHPCKSLSAEPEDDKQHMLDDSVLLHNRLHQIFVTRNRLLCSEAKRNFNEMKHGSSIAQKFGLCDDSPLPWHFDDIRDSQYPLFLTLEQLLILMDASVGPNFFYARESNGSLKGRQRSLFEEDSSISGITEHMRKGGIVVQNETSKSKEASKLTTEVTYEVFCDIVWPKIATGCKYQPLLVWMEFISIIKGSYEALLQPKGYLSRERYLDVGRKRAPNFDGNRDEIYDLFQKYQKISDKKNLFDECDIINSVKSRLQPQHVKAWAIHQLFVDEIQDFTQAELCLLIKICQDPNQMFLTGDTAQTVMHGIEFRFCDLKSLFFNIREAMKADGVPGKYLVEVPGKVHQLTHSYRSHDGILSLASSILDIMTHLFPDSFDHLQADTSLIQGGPLPVLLESSNFSDLARHISDNKEETEDTADIELGVHQAILVINETARQQLPRQLQQNITLTIYESKGLEFNNIFLFNFFKFSQASKEWRAVTSLLTELTPNDTDTTNSRTGVYELDEGKLHRKDRPRALKFDPKLHKVLNSELKLLYTAVTRARVKVWIFDEDEENRRPMFDYFKARNLVSVKTERFTKDDFNEPASENDEWLARGKEFMRTRVYREAAKCFKKGGDIKSADIANARHSEVIARNVRDQASRKTKFLQTAKLYCKCGFHSEAMECYEEAGAFKAAAEYCDNIGKFEEAAKIYKKRVNNPVKSSDCYQKAHLFDTAVKVLYESGHYEKALDVVSRYDKQLKEMESENKIIPQLMKNHHPCKQYNWEDLRIKCAELYHREHKYDKMMEHMGHLSFDEHRNVLLQWDHIDLTVDLMKTKGKYEEASRLYLSKGRSKDALAIARESGNKENIAQYLLRDITGEICKHQVLDKPQTSDRIQELFDLLSVITTNRKLQGQAYLLKAELNGGKAKEVETALSKALGAFKQCDPPCKAGQIDCLNLMLKNLTQGNISPVVEEMHTLFDVIKLFEKTASTKDDSQTIKLICSHFGYEYSTDGLLLTKSCQHHLGPEIKRKCKSENEREVKKAIGNVLKELAHEWYTKIRSSMKEWVENLQTCSKSHYSHLRCGCLKKLLETDLLHIELDGYLAGTLGGISITAKKSIETSLEPCITFLRHLLPQQFIKRSSKEEWYALADVLRKTKRTVKERLMTALKVEYDYITQKKRKRSTNLFMKLHFLVKYLKLDMKPQEMMKTFEQDLNDELSRKENKQKVLGKIRHLGFLIHPEPIRCLAVRFVEAYDNISYYMDPMEALVKFTAFLRLLRGYDQEVLPDCNYLIMWMEYFLVVASYMAAKADNQISFLLPNSYTHVTHYIDSSFDSENKATINAVVRTGKKLNLHVIQNRIEAIALFLCEDGDKNKLMNAAFSSENTDFEVSERLGMLSLTCMCNIERMGTTSSEQLLLRQLSSIQLHTDAPPRLKDAIKTLKTAKGLLDVGNLFRRLLFERGEELHTYSFYKGNVLSKPLTILNDILPDTFHEDAARSQLQPQETDTTKESTNI